MDEHEISPPYRTRTHTHKKSGEKGNSSGKHGDKSTEAPTAKAAMDTLRKERDKWKARAEFLEEKLSDVTSDRDICRTQLSDALESLKGAQQSRREQSKDAGMGGSEQDSEGSEDDSESSSDSSESSDSSGSSDSSLERKRRKKWKGKRKKSGKKRKNKKEKKARKRKHRSRHRVGGPDDVVKRYKEVLAIFQTGKNMAKSFEKYGVDRLTIVKTAAIAELAIAAPEEYEQVEKGGTVSDFAKRCVEVINANQVISATINKMKADRKLLRIKKKV